MSQNQDQSTTNAAKSYNYALDFLSAIMDDGEVYALRVLYGDGGKKVGYEGLFKSPASMARSIVKLDRTPREMFRAGKGNVKELPFGIYVIPQPANPALIARLGLEKIQKLEDNGLKDHEVSARRALTLDIDSIKAGGISGISATDEERAAALALTADVDAFLAARGWAAPLVASSGNGGHLVYRLDLPNDQASHALVKAAILTLREAFKEDRRGDIDETVHNAARLWKVPGTMARKGLDTEERPHRMAELLSAPDRYKEQIVTREQLVELVEQAGTPEAKKLIGLSAPKPTGPTAKPAPKAAAPSSPAASSDDRIEQARARMLEDRSWVHAALEQIDPSKEVLPRFDWLAVGTALKALFPADGEQIFETWSRRYDPDYVAATDWRSFKDEPEQAACSTICGIAKRFGWSYKEWRAANDPAPAPKNKKKKAEAKPVEMPREPQRLEDGELAHPLARAWREHMPDWIYQQTGIGVAAGVYNQLALKVAPVRLGHRVLCCDPDTNRWVHVEEGDVARMLARWIGRVGLAESSSEEVVVRYNGGGGGANKIYNELVARVHDISRHQQAVGVQLVLADAVLRVDWRKGELVHEDLTPRHYAVHGYDYELAHVQRADAPRWQAYLEGLFDGAPDAQDRVEYLKRWAAIAIFGATISMQTPALLIKGKRGTGKSTLGKIIRALMPPGSTCSVPLQAWGHEYNRAELVGKLLNFVPEVAIDEPIGDLDQVKKIIFGEVTDAREIRQKPVSFYPRAAHLFCANGLPNLKKADPAVFHRFAQLEVTGRTIRGTRDDDTLFAEGLLADELPGILSDLISAMTRALWDYKTKAAGTANGLPLLASSQAANEEWRGRSDAVAAWLTETFEHDPTLSLNRSPTLAEMWRAFKLWAEEANYHLPNKGTFKVLVGHHYTIGQVNKQDVAHGARRINVELHGPV